MPNANYNAFPLFLSSFPPNPATGCLQMPALHVRVQQLSVPGLRCPGRSAVEAPYGGQDGQLCDSGLEQAETPGRYCQHISRQIPTTGRWR